MKNHKKRSLNPLRKKARARRRRAREESLYTFDATPTLEELADVQGVSPITNYDEVTSGANWPEDQSVEDFIAAATESRYEEDKPSP
jgi:hypothetical protein